MREMLEYGIGGTPLVSVPGAPNGNEILLKQEGTNFLGSVKSRTAYYLVSGLRCQRTDTVVEASSGNLALGLAYFCSEEKRTFRCLLDKTTMPPKLEALRSMGAQIEIVSSRDGYDLRDSRIARARELAQRDGYEWTNQYDNEWGILAHFETTGPEIYRQTCGQIDYLIAAVGSGGTIIGTGRFLKLHLPGTLIVGVEPLGSTIHSSLGSRYLNAGAGMSGMPGNVEKNRDVIDAWATVEDAVSIRRMVELSEIGISAGVTTGMAFDIALELASTVRDKKIVVVSPDGAGSYEFLIRNGR